jgi:hypothetical protein
MELTKTERLMAAQILNTQVEKATLREHIQLEKLFNKLDAENIRLPIPPDYVDDEHQELFSKYENKKVSDIEDENDKAIIQDAMQKARQDEMKFWSNEDKETKTIDLSDEDISKLLEFFDKDERQFPREYHQAIVDLYNKLEEVRKK